MTGYKPSLENVRRLHEGLREAGFVFVEIDVPRGGKTTKYFNPAEVQEVIIVEHEAMSPHVEVTMRDGSKAEIPI